MTKAKPTPYLHDEEMEDSITFLIHKVSLNYAAQSARMTKSLNGLGLTEWRVLFCLAHSGKSAPIDIARKIALDKSQISKTVAAMARKSLVSLEADPTDLRYKLVDMTPEGVAAYNQVVPVLRKRRDAVLQGLSKADIDTVRAALKLIDGRIPEVEDDLLSEVEAARSARAETPSRPKEIQNAAS